jgi:ammonia channel protein AmtB
MLEFRDLFQWERFITPTMIKPFCAMALALIILLGISGILTGLAAMAINPFGGFLSILVSIVGTIVGVMFTRLACEFVLIVFRINEHLGAIRDQGAPPS